MCKEIVRLLGVNQCIFASVSIYLMCVLECVQRENALKKMKPDVDRRLNLLHILSTNTQGIFRDKERVSTSDISKN